MIQNAHPGLPVFLLGHSMGSFLLRTYMFQYGTRINGAIISGTAGSPGILGDIGMLVANLEIKRKGLRGKSQLLHQLSFGGYNKTFKLPILILSGDKDPVGKNGKGVSQVYQSLKKTGIKDIQLSLYPDGRHEMLNETNRHEVYRDVITWLDHHVS
jgi:alpha-beta hydrolase superfamily lysophospholipase